MGNNVLFALFAFVVLLGTVFPLLVEAINSDRVSVGSPYFNRMTSPIVIALLFLMAVAPVLPWRKASGELLRDRLFWPAWVGTASLVIALLLGGHGFTPMVAYGLAGFAAGSALRQLVLATRRQGWRGLVGRANGGMIVHLGVLIIAVAFAASQSSVRQAEFTLAPGEQATFAGHTLTFEGTQVVQDSNKVATKALIDIDGTGPWAPALNQFSFGNQTIGTPSVRSTPARRRGAHVVGVTAGRGRRGDDSRDRATARDVAVGRRWCDGDRHDPRRLPGQTARPARPGVGSCAHR